MSKVRLVLIFAAFILFALKGCLEPAEVDIFMPHTWPSAMP